MPSVAILIRLWWMSFSTLAHSEEISSKLAQFWNLSCPAGELVRLARVVHLNIPQDAQKGCPRRS